MLAIVALAMKDLRLLLRNRGALFFTLVWPLIVAILFGLAFGGDGGGGMGRLRVVLVDLDRTAGSLAFVEHIGRVPAFDTDESRDEAAARELVRHGRRSAAIIVPAGYGDAAGTAFVGESPRVLVVIDPSRRAERAIVIGELQRVAGERLVAQLNPGDATWQPLVLGTESVQRASDAPRNRYALTFAQGLLWAMVGCLMSFATALALERTQGTLVRLRASPMSPGAVLFGKGLACWIAMIVIATTLLALGALGFGVRPESPGLLVVAVAVTAFACTGLMMLVASLGETMQTVSGAGWALMMPLMLFGGGMIPLFVMPAWMQRVGAFSPLRWGNLALEGALWRGFTAMEMVPALSVLVVVGTAALTIGCVRVARRTH
jgi:ABC-2 type transport system permease protein